MGNAQNVFDDITEAGNSWRHDSIKAPTGQDLFGSNSPLEDWFSNSPTFLWSPLEAPGTNTEQEPAQETSSPSDASESRREGRRRRDRATRHSSQYSNSALSWMSFDEPRRVVLQPANSTRNEGDYRQQRKVQWMPLDSHVWFHEKIQLNQKRYQQLLPHLPLCLRIASSLRLLYSPLVHGVSIRTFFRQCHSYPGETLVLVQDTSGALFGGFASHAWSSRGTNHHFGSTECFVFNFKEADLEQQEELTVHRWAGGNEHFMFASLDGISFGGGSSLALWIDKNFLIGTSAACETFTNTESLSGSKEFVIRSFECWGFDDSMPSSSSQTAEGSGAGDSDRSPTATTERALERMTAAEKLHVWKQQLREQACDALRFEAFN